MSKANKRTVKKKASAGKSATEQINADQNAGKKQSFLATLREKYSVYHSCKTVGIGRTAVYQWRKNDEQFAADWDDAKEDAIDDLESSLYERAIKSDTTAAIFILKGARPEKYRDRFEHSGNGGKDLIAPVINVILQTSDKTEPEPIGKRPIFRLKKREIGTGSD